MRLQLQKFNIAIEVPIEGHVQATYSACDKNKKKKTRKKWKKYQTHS